MEQWFVTSSPFGCVKSKTLAGMESLNFDNQIISMNKIRHWFEKYGFEVSNRLADRLGMKVKNVRLFFIYASFATFGGFFGLYLTLAF